LSRQASISCRNDRTVDIEVLHSLDGNDGIAVLGLHDLLAVQHSHRDP